MWKKKKKNGIESVADRVGCNHVIRKGVNIGSRGSVLVSQHHWERTNYLVTGASVPAWTLYGTRLWTSDCAREKFSIQIEMCEIAHDDKNRRKIIQESAVKWWESKHHVWLFLARSRAADVLKKINSRGTWTEETVLPEQSTWSDVSSPEKKFSRRWSLRKNLICARKEKKTFFLNKRLKGKSS